MGENSHQDQGIDCKCGVNWSFFKL
jgi:hypothetical protein